MRWARWREEERILYLPASVEDVDVAIGEVVQCELDAIDIAGPFHESFALLISELEVLPLEFWGHAG